jgi:cytochrome c6
LAHSAEEYDTLRSFYGHEEVVSSRNLPGGKMRKTLVRIIRLLLLSSPILLLAAIPVRAQDNGAALFKSKCASCHGPDGKGDTPVGKALKLRDLGSEDVQKQTDAQLTEITANGKGKMPAYKGKLTDDQIKQLVSFMRSFKKK